MKTLILHDVILHGEDSAREEENYKLSLAWPVLH